MSAYTALNVPTEFVEVEGIRFAYRRFGQQRGIPVVFCQHFIGNLDNWDPAVIDGFARDREIIIFNNRGIASTNGEVPTNFDEIARDAATFVAALGLTKIDLLGFSIGGIVAQLITLNNPDLVRRLILVGTGPRIGEGMTSLTPEAQEIFGKQREVADEVWLEALFSPTETSQIAARAFLERYRQRSRSENRDMPVSEKVAPAQIAAIMEWGLSKGERFGYLKQIKQPTLVVNGSHDVIIYTINSFILQQTLPNAQLILYPDSNHGSQYQYPEMFVEHATLFLDTPAILPLHTNEIGG